MAGRPKLKKLAQHIESLGGDHIIMDQIAAGEKMKHIAGSLRGFLPGDADYPSKSEIYRWIHLSEDREDAWQEARRISAHTVVDNIDELLEDAQETVVTSAEASIVKKRAEHAKWLAGVYNRHAYGEEKEQANVNVSIGELHLDALRSHGSMQGRVIEAEEVQDALPEGEDEEE